MKRLPQLIVALVIVCSQTAFGNENVVGATEDERLGTAPQGTGLGLFAGQTFAEHGPMTLLGETIPPGSYRQLTWSATELFEGLPVDTPVLVVHGRQPGPTLCLTAAVHGDELNGIEIVRRVLHGLQPSRLGGTVIGVPIVNIQGFRRGTRYLPDRRDLNRHFPGTTTGSAASRIASSFFNNIVLNCDALIDLHTGSFERTNLPQLRADLSDDGVDELARAFGATVIVNSQPRAGTLRYAATLAGVPTVTLEAGGPEELESLEVTHGVKGIETLMHRLRMVNHEKPWTEREEIYYRSAWVRADKGGILIANVELGSRVTEGDLLGRVTDPI
ncbi:MAG: succinylglutamate desuccinylase/aspartoacylase family protein, partial [Pseudomonadota bacterium]